MDFQSSGCCLSDFRFLDVPELPQLGASRARLLCRLRDKFLDLPRLFFFMALRRLRASLPVSFVLVEEELTLVALIAAALMVDIFTVVGCVASVDFRSTPAALEVKRAIGFNNTPICGRPPVRLNVEASSEGSAALSSGAT
ncbi:hypothetical protein MRX96_059875 [Rhipicephalus microplus]